MCFFVNGRNDAGRIIRKSDAGNMHLVACNLRFEERNEPLRQTFIVRSEGVGQNHLLRQMLQTAGQLGETGLAVSGSHFGGDYIALVGDYSVILLTSQLSLSVDNGHVMAEGGVAEDRVTGLRAEVLTSIGAGSQIAEDLTLLGGQYEAAHIVMIMGFSVVTGFHSQRIGGLVDDHLSGIGQIIVF